MGSIVRNLSDRAVCWLMKFSSRNHTSLRNHIAFIGIALGLFLFAKTGVELLWIGFIGALATYFYYKLKFAALGDFVIFIVYGPLIGLGTAFVMTDQLMWNTVLLNIPVAFLVVNILHSNNMRDIRDDGKANIKTRAMVMGIKNPKFNILYWLSEHI